jgi:hypothetical protein
VAPALTSRDEWNDWITWHGLDVEGGITARFTDDPGLLPPALAETLTPIGAELVVRAGHADLDLDNRISCHVVAEVLFETWPHEAGVVEFRFDTLDNSATLERIFLPRPEHGNYHGKRLMLRSLRLLDALEMNTFHLTAQGVGKYLWANCGFDFDRGYADIVNEACAELAWVLDLIETPAVWEPLHHPWQFAGLNVDDDGNPVAIPVEHVQGRLDAAGWELPTPLPRDSEVAPSKALLIHSRYKEWRGTFYLRDPLARDILARYGESYDDPDPTH